MADDEASATIDLLWIPLGAGAGSGGRTVRCSGGTFEWLSASRGRRPRQDLFHSALEITVPEGRFVIEMTPIPDEHGQKRGVVSEGPVGSRRLGRYRIFRYEIRRWRDGVIADADLAVLRLTLGNDLDRARRILECIASVPTPVWGRDELRAGEMWNSNSVIAWVLRRAGVDTDPIAPPERGRAPGWLSGLVVARRRPAPELP